jgi:hypothetical protein
MPFTHEETGLILRAIREDKAFRTQFGVVAEVIVDKVYSFFTNPNCSCKGAIIDWTNKNEEKTRELINTFKETFEKLKQTAPVPMKAPAPAQPPVPGAPPVPGQAPQQPPNVKIGETISIDATPEAYKKLFETVKAERWVFRGLQVIPGEADGKDVWFVLFY